MSLGDVFKSMRSLGDVFKHIRSLDEVLFDHLIIWQKKLIL